MLSIVMMQIAMISKDNANSKHFICWHQLQPSLYPHRSRDEHANRIELVPCVALACLALTRLPLTRLALACLVLTRVTRGDVEVQCAEPLHRVIAGE